jgi:hypothetical protein
MILLCQACFNGAEPAMRDSLNAGILVLLGVTGLVLTAFGAFFLQLARRARAAAPPGGEGLLPARLDSAVATRVQRGFHGV